MSDKRSPLASALISGYVLISFNAWSAPQEDPTLRNAELHACGEEIEAHCELVRGDHERMGECIEENFASFSEQCRNTIERQRRRENMVLRVQGMTVNSDTRANSSDPACVAEITKQCGAKVDNREELQRCIEESLAGSSMRCKAAISEGDDPSTQ